MNRMYLIPMNIEEKILNNNSQFNKQSKKATSQGFTYAYKV